MKYFIPIVFSLVIISNISSCIPERCDGYMTNRGNWARQPDLKMADRTEAVSFTIGNSVYVGTGWDGVNTRFGDFWKYNPTLGTWEQIAGLPSGAERNSAVGFSILGFGYCGTGFDGSHYLNDFYKYDPGTNAWTKINSVLPGNPRSEAVAFAVSDTGYVGTGYDGSAAMSDFYKYDAVNDHWTAIPFEGQPRYGAVSIVFSNSAYVVTGANGQGFPADFWVFNFYNYPSAWHRLNDISNSSSDSYDDAYNTITRRNGSVFVLGNYAYLSGGENNISYTSTWEYDFSSDLWFAKTPFEGSPTTGAVGFSTKNKGFIASGKNDVGVSAQFWEFQPDAVENPNDN